MGSYFLHWLGLTASLLMPEVLESGSDRSIVCRTPGWLYNMESPWC